MKSFVVTSLLAVGALQVGCKGPAEAESSAKDVPATLAATTPAAAASSASPSSSAQAKFDEEAFELRLEAPASAKVGEALSVSVVLTAKAGYKVNPEYPLKFSFDESASVKPEQPVLRKEQATIEKTQATLKGKAISNAAGQQTISGKLNFSVCTEARCLIEKRDLAVTVAVN